MVGVSGLRHGKEPFEVRADVVVGADGRYSAIARLGGFEPEYEHHDFDIIWFTIEQPPGWSSTFYVSLGEVRGLMLPKYPHHIQAGILLPTGEWKTLAAAKAWRRWPIASGASTRSSPAFADGAEGLHAVLPAGGHHPLRRRLGARRPAADRRRRAHHEPGRRHRRQRGAGDGGGGRAGDLSASRPRADRARRPARGPAAARGRRADAASAAARRPAACCSASTAATRSCGGWCRGCCRWLLQSPLLPRVQRRIFFGAPLPPLDPAFSFR